VLRLTFWVLEVAVLCALRSELKPGDGSAKTVLWVYLQWR
jgi:hypothetical protein